MAAVLHISGPPRSGKTTLARILAARAGVERPAYHVRCFLEGDDRAVYPKLWDPLEEMAGAEECVCNDNQVFEQLRAAIDRVRRRPDCRRIFVESGTASCFRHAYPFDVKAFVMPCPHRPEEVFRTPEQTLQSIEKALEGTTQFATELFGLPPAGGTAPSAAETVRAPSLAHPPDRGFLRTDIGTEISSRLHFRPAYQGLLDSDVIILNDGLGHASDSAGSCARRIQTLVGNIRRLSGRQLISYICEPLDVADNAGALCLEHIESLVRDADGAAR